MEMLQGWLNQNSYCSNGYEIVSRQAVKKSGLLYDVFYEGRCK
jgi:hypothetical protein